MIVSTLKKSNSLLNPFSIPTSKCPDHSKRCKKYHGEYVILKYMQDGDKFLVRSYPVHAVKYSEAWFTSDKLISMFQYCINKRYFTIPDLLKRVDLTEMKMKKLVRVMFTKSEVSLLKNKAKKEKMNLSQFVRKKSLS